MEAIVLATSGGPHPADTWAVLTAQALVDLNDFYDPSDPRFEAALNLQRAVLSLLLQHYSGIQDRARRALAKEDYSFTTPETAAQLVADILLAIVELAAQTPWAAHWLDPLTQEMASEVLTRHLLNVLNIENQWHCDRSIAAEQPA